MSKWYSWVSAATLAAAVLALSGAAEGRGYEVEDYRDTHGKARDTKQIITETKEREFDDDQGHREYNNGIYYGGDYDQEYGRYGQLYYDRTYGPDYDYNRYYPDGIYEGELVEQPRELGKDGDGTPGVDGIAKDGVLQTQGLESRTVGGTFDFTQYLGLG